MYYLSNTRLRDRLDQKSCCKEFNKNSIIFRIKENKLVSHYMTFTAWRPELSWTLQIGALAAALGCQDTLGDHKSEREPAGPILPKDEDRILSTLTHTTAGPQFFLQYVSWSGRGSAHVYPGQTRGLAGTNTVVTCKGQGGDHNGC